MLARQPSRLAPEHCRPFLWGATQCAGGMQRSEGEIWTSDQDVVVWMRGWVGGAGMNWGMEEWGKPLSVFNMGCGLLERSQTKSPLSSSEGVWPEERGQSSPGGENSTAQLAVMNRTCSVL